MKKLLALFLLFGIVGCASSALLRFPVAQYVEDNSAVELRFACITKRNFCIAGLYLDNMQVHEAYGDYSIFNSGMNPKNIYKLRVPPSKYKFSSDGSANSNLDRFLDISRNSCAIYIADTTDYNWLNIFEKLKPNELTWSLIDCNEFDKLTSNFDEIELLQPIYFTKQKQ
tara:strand:+ start:80 stop:589 length:510 start_codon:yes stop_codon:yes gene_type:complete